MTLLKNFMGYSKVPTALIIAQAQLESGNFSSNIFKENHNLFGMKLPSRRPTMAIGENRGFAVYPSWMDSVVDYFLRQQAFGISNTEYVQEYMAQTVSSGYVHGDPGYRDKWYRLYEKAS
ncbi:MAG: glucosaminidase domain-containing protein [Actinomycetia bacterium]|nr:glucosaminidase domain-containing protein [Actinomycetes bacterium]